MPSPVRRSGTGASIRIQGVRDYLWRAVDQHGVVLDIPVRERRDASRQERFFERLLIGLQYEPRVIVTIKLRSYGVARRQVLPRAERRQSRYLNNSAENSLRPTPTSRAPDVAIEITQAGAAFPLGLCVHLWSFPSATDAPHTVRHVLSVAWRGGLNRQHVRMK